MNKQIIDLIYSEYVCELQKQLTTDDFFHVDVTVDYEGYTYELISTLFAESTGLYPHDDYDSPPEQNKPNIVIEFYSLIQYDRERNQIGWFDKECEEIVTKAIKNYKP